ncbi:hypothetical protein F7725_007295 [Dissostichus mawsoni]|uniref:Uncharacterized protein n=1 Tax=Dissostichus mawsoni TaxID=36200 RepID=A0A7J5XXC4_DISMA|nr:hypothetical protein F7725_007295 [Dissostichus mawsoni]
MAIYKRHLTCRDLAHFHCPQCAKNNFNKRRYGGTPEACHKLPSTSASEHCPGPSSSSPQPNTSAVLSLLLPTTTKPFTVNKSWTVERDDWFGNRVIVYNLYHLYSTEMQLYGNDCGIFMLMYALYTILDAPYDFTIIDMPACEKWWCVMLMENFDLGRKRSNFSVIQLMSQLEKMWRKQWKR